MMLVVVLVTAVLCGKSSAQSCSSDETEEITDVECYFDSAGRHKCSPFLGRFLSGEVRYSIPRTAECAVNSTGVTAVEFPSTCILSVRSCVPVTADLCGADEILATSQIFCKASAPGPMSCVQSPSDFPGTVAIVMTFSTGPVPTCDISATLEATTSVPGVCTGRVLSCVAATTQSPSCNAGEMPVLTGVTCIRSADDLTNPCETTLADIPGRFVEVGVTSVVSTEGTFRRFCTIDKTLAATIIGGHSVCHGFAASCVAAPPPPACEESEESSETSEE